MTTAQPLLDELAAALRSLVDEADYEVISADWPSMISARAALARYDAYQAEPRHLQTCGTAYRGCDPACPFDASQLEEWLTDDLDA